MNTTPDTYNDVIRLFAMAVRGQSPDEYNAEDNHTRRTAEKQIDTALRVTGFHLVHPTEASAGSTGPWPTLLAVHPSIGMVIDSEGDRWRRVGEPWEFGDTWQLFDKKTNAWRPWEISLRQASFFAPFSCRSRSRKTEYPHPGRAGTTILGPEIFTNGEVINWRGENFVRQTVQPCATRYSKTHYVCALATGHYGDHTTVNGEHWQSGTAALDAYVPVVADSNETGAWPNLLAVPQTVNKVLDKDGDAWTRTPRGWKCGNQVCTSGSGGGGCLAGHPKYGPFVAVKAGQ